VCFPPRTSQNVEIESNFLSSVKATLGQVKEIGLQSVDGHPCFRLSVMEESVDHIRQVFNSAIGQNEIDYLLLPEQKQYKLAIFDVDGTLLDAECIDEVAREAGVVDKVALLTKKAMEEDWDFTVALRERLALVEDLPESKLEEVFSRLLLKKGVASLIKTLKEKGIKTAMVSGGFTFFTDRIASRLGFDYAFANVLEINDGKLTGKSLPPVVDGKMKLRVLQALCSKLNISLSECIAMGDGSNDKFMISAAGLGVAFHAKKILKEHTPHHINFSPMNFLCHAVGLTPVTTSTEQLLSKHNVTQQTKLMLLEELIDLKTL